MANTYTLIASNTLSSSAASVTFSSIPQTYTDLVLKASVRTTYAGTDDVIYLTLGSGSGSYHSLTRLYTNASTITSNRSSNANSVGFQNANGDTSTSNTFGYIELYFPNYTSTSSKPFSTNAAQEDNSSTAWQSIGAGLFRDTAALSSIQIAGNAGSWKSGSSFFLYGIKNS